MGKKPKPCDGISPCERGKCKSSHVCGNHNLCIDKTKSTWKKIGCGDFEKKSQGLSRKKKSRVVNKKDSMGQKKDVGQQGRVLFSHWAQLAKDPGKKDFMGRTYYPFLGGNDADFEAWEKKQKQQF